MLHLILCSLVTALHRHYSGMGRCECGVHALAARGRFAHERKLLKISADRIVGISVGIAFLHIGSTH